VNPALRDCRVNPAPARNHREPPVPAHHQRGVWDL